MATTRYCPSSCDPAEIYKYNNCNDVITFWDCLFGKDRWKDLYRKRGDVRKEEGKMQKITTQKDLREPAAISTTIAANKPKKSEKQAKKPKTIFHREVYSLEIEPTNLLRYLWPWKMKEHKAKDAENMKNKQEDRKNQNEHDKKKKPFVKRRIREEQGVVLENTNNDGLNGRKMRTETMRRRYFEGQLTKQKKANENEYSHDNIISSSNAKTPIKKVPSPTFITAQLTDLSTKIDKLENTIINLSSINQSHLGEQRGGDKNATIPSIQKSGHNTSKGRNRNVTKVGRCVTSSRVCNGRNNTKVGRKYGNVDENLTKMEENDTKSFINVTKLPKRYKIQRSESNPSLLTIHPPNYANCHKNNKDACILIHTQKKTVCVHGSYLDAKQNQSWWNQISYSDVKQNHSWWNQIRNIFSVSLINKVFYKNTDMVSKNEDDDNHNDTEIANKKKNCDNTECSTDDESFQSFDEYDFGEELNSSCLKVRKNVSYTILNNSNRFMEFVDHDHNKKQEKTVENILNTCINVLQDSNSISREKSSEMIDKNFHSTGISEDPVKNIAICNKTVENPMTSNSDMNSNSRPMLGDFCGNNYNRQPNSYLMNKDDRQRNYENKHSEMELWTNKNFEQNEDVLYQIVKEKEEICGVETSKNKFSKAPENRLMTFTKILHSKFKSKDLTTEYEEMLTKTMKSEYTDTLGDLSILKQFTTDESYSFFPFSEKKCQKEEENYPPVFPSNLVGTRVYQVYESEELGYFEELQNQTFT